MNFIDEFNYLESDDKLMLFLAVSESLPIEDENGVKGDFRLEETDGLKDFLCNNAFSGNPDEYIEQSLNDFVETKFAYLGKDEKICFKKELVENVVYGTDFSGDDEILQKTIFDDYTKAEYAIFLEKTATELAKLLEPLSEADKSDLKELATEFDSPCEIKNLFSKKNE